MDLRGGNFQEFWSTRIWEFEITNKIIVINENLIANHNQIINENDNFILSLINGKKYLF